MHAVIVEPGEHGAWKYCVEEDLRRIIGEEKTALKLAVMADAERTDYHEDFLPKKESAVDMVRVATYISQIPAATPPSRSTWRTSPRGRRRA